MKTTLTPEATMHEETMATDLPIELGIFAKTFQQSPVDQLFDTMAGHGLSCTQWNWTCVAGLPSLPEIVPRETARRVARAAAQSGIRIAAVSTTFNLIQPVVRNRALAQLPALAEAALAIGCDLLTLCTGTRHPVDMWTDHPDNAKPQAWVDMIDGLRAASRIAARCGVRLAIEPETANVVADAVKAQRALGELDADGALISIILDAANLYRPPFDPRTHPGIIDDALARLGSSMSLAHAKDIADPGSLGSGATHSAPDHYTHVAAGTGILSYAHYLAALARTAPRSVAVREGRKLPLILHGLSEAQVPASVAFVRQALAAVRLR